VVAAGMTCWVLQWVLSGGLLGALRRLPCKGWLPAEPMESWQHNNRLLNSSHVACMGAVGLHTSWLRCVDQL